MNIISQKFTDVLKNRLKNKISDLANCFIDEIVKSFTSQDPNKYLTLLADANRLSINLIKDIIIEVINEFDVSYRDSTLRKCKYYVNKKDVTRTITTIIGEITFTRTYYEDKASKQKFFYIDDLLNLPKYDHYDPVVKGLAIKESFYSNQSQAGRIIGERIANIQELTNKDTTMFSIPKQSINNWIKSWNVNIHYDRNKSTPKTLYIMGDEKYIGCQDLDGDIMAKAFVVFEGVKEISKGRRALINRHLFTCYSNHPWEELLDRLIEIYDYNQINEIYVLSDGGNWLTAGMSELKLETFQKVEHFLCLFHYKQSINHITTIKEERTEIFNSFINDRRKDFKDKLNTYIIKYPHKKDTIEKKITYLLKHYKAAKHMISSSIGSSMESHISHFIASTFSSRPKGYSVENINKYFMLNDAKINGINIFNTYLQTYDKTEEVIEYNEINNETSAIKKVEYLPAVSIPYLSSSSVTTNAYNNLSYFSGLKNTTKII